MSDGLPIRPLFADDERAAIIEVPGQPDAAAWLQERSAEVEALAAHYPMLLVRGLALPDATAFARARDIMIPQTLAYTYRSTPRTAIGDGVLTATEYPAGETIPLHCENAYQREWPLRLVFACLIEPGSGGQTPLADIGAVTRRLGEDLLDRIEPRGIRYIRTYQPGIDLDWPTVFQTGNRDEVERFCAARDIAVTWLDNDRLRTAQTCQAVARHPETGDRLWFNQAHLFHPSALGADLLEDLEALFGAENLPRRAIYGDGAELEPELLDEIRAAFAAEQRQFDWQQGDFLILDNMRAAHGRKPYTGPRKIVVSMGISCDTNGLITRQAA